MRFEELLEKITPKLKRITQKLNGHFTFFDENDLFQEATIYLWSIFTTGKLKNKTESYILQGCYFHLKNYIRKKSDRIQKYHLDNSIEISDGENDKTEVKEPVDNFCLEDFVQEKIIIEKIITQLNDKEREILYSCLSELTTREIGKLLGVSHVSIIKTKNKIRKKCEFINNGYQK